MRLFAENGYHATTVDEIAGAVGVSPRTFYRYFPSKEEVLFDVSTDIRAAVVEVLSEVQPAISLADSITSAVVEVASAYDSQAELFQQMAQIMMASPELRSAGLEDLHRWEAVYVPIIARHLTDIPTSDATIGVLAGAVVAAQRIAHDRWMASGQQQDMASHVKESLAVLGPLFAAIESAENTRT
ncbi:MAG: TetR/AcrR family transcriptional regulator; helix-turn-helix transcriptional regulator [Acidimicrobiia bacterium]|nr:TetR/AcrR family transcriptional regulator; helix-turn-helix transcriptional regulator [Acidimicrobiia bacterium]MCY4433079.1 TetR family transcriptional regulator [bacterium]